MATEIKFNHEHDSSDIQIEHALLGALIYKPSVFDIVYNVIPSGDYFYTSVHGEIYEKIIELANSNSNFDLHVLRQHFKNHEDLEAFGGDEYLTDLVDNVISTVNCREYAITIKNLYLKRSIKDLFQETIHKIETDEEMTELSSVFESQWDKIHNINDPKGGLSMPSESLDESYKIIQDAQNGVCGLKTGLSNIDNMLKGLQGGNLYVWAGRPGMGKTALVLSIAGNIAKNGGKPFIFSLEMTKGQLMQRVIARKTGISVGQQMEVMSDSDYKKVLDARYEIEKLHLLIDDTSALNIYQIIMRSKVAVRKYGVNCIFVDYLGLIRSVGKTANKVHQIEEITQGLKSLAKDLNVPIILLSQLNRGVEQREDKRPMLSDLRDSGSIEQDADAVMFVYREEYYKEKEKPIKKPNHSEERNNQEIAEWMQNLEKCRGKAELLLVKNRQGTSGIDHVIFDGVKQEFRNE